MDFLEDAAPGLVAFFSEAFASFAKKANEVDVFVTDGKGRITAKGARVMHLKLAIKEAPPLTVRCDSTMLTTKDPGTGNAMGDEDALNAGVKYVFELPPLPADNSKTSP